MALRVLAIIMNECVLTVNAVLSFTKTHVSMLLCALDLFFVPIVCSSPDGNICTSPDGLVHPLKFSLMNCANVRSIELILQACNLLSDVLRGRAVLSWCAFL